MKILKQGNYKPTEYLFKCSECRCVFVEDENFCVTSTEITNNKYFLNVICPCCGCICKSDTIYTEEKDGDENG